MDNSDTLDQYFQQQELEWEHIYLIEALRSAASVWTEDQLAFVCTSCGVDMEDV